MQTRLKTAAGGVALAACALSAHAALPPGISGAWYSPAQSGHGVAVEVLAGDRADAFWMVYDHAGNPLHLYIVGAIEGHTMRGTAFHNRGMRFGVFDPAELEQAVWGTVTLAFEDCNNGTLAWNAHGEAGAGYGSGEIPITRLTAIAGLSCDLSLPQSSLPTGAYGGTWGRATGSGQSDAAYAAVDATGALWATSEWAASESMVASFGPPPVFVAHPVEADESTVRLDLDVYPNAGFDSDAWDWAFSAPLVFTRDHAGASAELDTDARPELVETLSLELLPGPGNPLRRSFDPASLTGATFRFSAYMQFFHPQYRVRFVGDDAFCIDTTIVTEFGCEYQGRIGATEPGLAMFEVTVTAPGGAGGPYVGKAWVLPATTAEPERLVLVSTDGRTGIGFAATRE